MADNYQNNDEYEFTDLDALSPDPLEVNDSAETASYANKARATGGNNIRRNALIAVAVVILAMLSYKFLGSFFTTKPKVPDAAVVTPPIQQPKPIVVQQPVTQPTPVVPVETVKPSVTEQELAQRVSALELGQQSLRSDLNSASEQLSGLNTNITELSDKINHLADAMTALTQRVEEQSTQIELLTERTKPQKVVVRTSPVKRAPLPQYFIQAVIPGRAWLISTNGSTLTVREGTLIAGYGVVRLIDAHQGRVLTSSGRVIRFSPQDS